MGRGERVRLKRRGGGKGEGKRGNGRGKVGRGRWEGERG